MSTGHYGVQTKALSTRFLSSRPQGHYRPTVTVAEWSECIEATGGRRDTGACISIMIDIDVSVPSALARGSGEGRSSSCEALFVTSVPPGNINTQEGGSRRHGGRRQNMRAEKQNVATLSTQTHRDTPINTHLWRLIVTPGGISQSVLCLQLTSADVPFSKHVLSAPLYHSLVPLRGHQLDSGSVLDSIDGFKAKQYA